MRGAAVNNRMTRVDLDSVFSSESSSRNSAGISDHGVRISIDLVAAARRHLSFLKSVSNSPWLNHTPTLLQAIRRYDQLWMPLVAELSDSSTMLLPPWDVQWIWHCHCLNPISFRQYCLSRFSTLVEKPAIFDDENEDYAWNRCREVWSRRYPSEPFDLEPDSEPSFPNTSLNHSADILLAVSKHRSLYSKFSEPFMAEVVFLIAAKHRYRGFLYLLHRFREGYPYKMIPTSDIFLMWTTHQSFPATYARDMGETEGDLQKVGVWDSATEEDMKLTAKLWETTFDQPYEKAGVTFDRIKLKSLIYWEVSDFDANRNLKLKSLEPRFVMEVCIFVNGKWAVSEEEARKLFLRLRTVRCHQEFKLDKPVSGVSSPECWQKAWQLHCEFSTKGVVLEVRRGGGRCFRGSKLKRRLVFLWNDLLRAPSLSVGREVEREVRVVASITPPVQGPYLLKCVPDRVTDDAGAMISDVILRMSKYRPQEGRWLSRTVLNHAGRECFVLRIRVGRGIWRRGAETPVAVKWEERIIQICEGSWSYVAGSIGIAPGNVVGMATPKGEESQGQEVTWSLSTGDDLTIRWETGIHFHLQNRSSDESVRLLSGRKLHYRQTGITTEKEKEEEGFLTLVRYNADSPDGKATALLNWDLFAVEVSPEEDVVLVLLLCTAIVRTVTGIEKETAGNLLVRRRVKGTKAGSRDWGSVTMHPSSSFSYSASCDDTGHSSQLSPYLLPWHWNPKDVLAPPESDYDGRPAYKYSPADGGEQLYRAGMVRKKS